MKSRPITQAVKDILARMQAELPPPIQLRDNAEAQEQEQVRVLSGWSREVLEASSPLTSKSDSRRPRNWRLRTGTIQVVFVQQ